MFSFPRSTLLALALASAAARAHSISHVRRHHVPRAQPPAGWATGYLEVYDVYHERYMAIGCENKHNTSFFDFCCHPLLVSNDPHTPSRCFSPRYRLQSPDADDEDCDPEEESSTVKAATSTHAAAALATSSTLKMTTVRTTAKSASTANAAPPKATTSTRSTTEVATTSTQSTTQAATTSTPKPKPTTTSTAETSTKTSSPSSGDFTTGGDGTFFYQNGVAGACGAVHKDTQFVVALQTQTYAGGNNCNRKIRVINTSNGKSVDGVVADECPTCNNAQSVDMSVAMFEKLADLGVGLLHIKWQFLD
ncbi:RlpA-like double-psi beta-barrel-protein domain-containing protein-containing protein [Mycena belliarum]|uniref:RlpA-like double-psi beta-barrel-protein domain-containing protein-containing protein n=1 Tax=Mycena belliarum TaxID=1033014 RepID=A0AAD6UB52_9AGAR|nr:RlpA-like double-psi beta-barrel-protein domain-containing protein-containing protein [Mycena belliae]